MIRVIHACDAPTIFFVGTNENGQPLLIDHHGFAHTRESAQELIRSAESHLEVFPDNDAVLQSNIRHDEKLRQRDEELVKQTKLSRRNERDGFVYLCRNLRNGLIKIGWSTKPNHRERTLQSEEPDIEFIHVFKGSLSDEQRLHDRYAVKRRRGEWFALSKGDVACIIMRNRANRV